MEITDMLPEGWTEEQDDICCRYWQAVDGFDQPVERVYASDYLVKVWPQPAHWPAIPQTVLVRAAVQCHRLREAGQ